MGQLLSLYSLDVVGLKVLAVIHTRSAKTKEEERSKTLFVGSMSPIFRLELKSQLSERYFTIKDSSNDKIALCNFNVLVCREFLQADMRIHILRDEV